MVSAGEGGGLAEEIPARALAILRECRGIEAWERLKAEVLSEPYPFSVHETLFRAAYQDWSDESGPPPAWIPTANEISQTHLYAAMRARGFGSYTDFHSWSVREPGAFWEFVIHLLSIPLKRAADKMVDLSSGAAKPHWLMGAQLNIAESCFQAPSQKVAVIHTQEGGETRLWTYGELDSLSNRVAGGLVDLGLKPGDRVAIDLAMSAEAVAIYLGIIKAGCAAVSIADSFAADEIQTRLRISESKAIFTQDVIRRGGKSLPMYAKVVAAKAPRAIVLSAGVLDGVAPEDWRNGDLTWSEFLPHSEHFAPVACSPDAITNVLFSSGTTGDPKAIPWTQLTPVKCAMDAYFHQDVHPTDILAWPTNLGWMMGPWLIYATLMNRATMAIYEGVPSGREFGEFVQNHGVTILGLVPSIVKSWRTTDCMKGLNWSRVREFSSTGECSNASDDLFLMSLAGYRPIIEYCGGTEIGGAYVTQTLLQPASPATFSTPALGLGMVVLDEEGNPTTNGEVFLIGPSIGLSNDLLNRDHHEVYFKDTPAGPQGELLRRHGDQVERLSHGYYRAHGRADDTMNLGGIKVSSAELERVMNGVEDVVETAAIAVNPAGGGPSLLTVFAVLRGSSAKISAKSSVKTADEIAELKRALQREVSSKLNPLFKIHDLQVVESLPRTASNKVMRRVLRDRVKT